jgi:DNA-3-methyladenine glycosylase II
MGELSKSTSRSAQSYASLADRKVWQKGIRHLKKNDAVLSNLISEVGSIPFEMDNDHYDALVGSIIYQQLAGTAARAILNRFKDLYGGRIPRPKEYLSTPIKKLRVAGLSPQKISYIKDLAQRLESGKLDLKRLEGMSDDDAVRELDEVKGVGRWTAEMFLIFMLGRTDVLPVDDLGLQKAAKTLYGLRKLPTGEKLERLAEKWHPYSSISTLYLWRSTEKPEAPAKW